MPLNRKYRFFFITKARKIILKLGTKVLLSHEKDMEHEKISRLIEDIVHYRSKGYEFYIVTSGAVGFGMRTLGVETRPTDLKKIQALASVGQGLLMQKWNEVFGRYNIPVGQILLTYDVIENRKRFLHARDCLNALEEYGAVPIINENDSVSVDELKFGDNDTLSAVASNLIEADLLVLFTDTDGVFTKNPHRHPDAQRIPLIEEVNDEVLSLIEDRQNQFSLGGMRSKLKAAQMSATAGTGVIITDGFAPNLRAILEGQDVGTFVKPENTFVKEKKKWIFFNRKIKGKIFVDEGAENALVNHLRSLLPGGVVRTEDSFDEGDLVGVFNGQGEMIGKGITFYASEEIGKIKGHRSDEIRKDLEGDRRFNEEVIHRDNMIVFR
ncbi:MAG: glutamate 5-kinase [bacterium]|nr:glutamate 5-kinase [bacterium]